jgi:hypothetical protein
MLELPDYPQVQVKMSNLKSLCHQLSNLRGEGHLISMDVRMLELPDYPQVQVKMSNLRSLCHQLSNLRGEGHIISYRCARAVGLSTGTVQMSNPKSLCHQLSNLRGERQIISTDFRLLELSDHTQVY